MKTIRVLYAGDSAVGGLANYLLGILKSINAKTTHLPPARRLKAEDLKKGFDAIIFSDYSRRQVPDKLQKVIAAQVQDGCGFLMIGGWGSFSGPFGGWHHSPVEDLLPVNCLGKDDRINFPGGALLIQKSQHPILQNLSFNSSPVIVGLNDIHPKKNARVLLTARKIIQVAAHTVLDPAEHPFLVVGDDRALKVAALATDIAPHWCGGFVDWGTASIKLPVRGKIQIEVGNGYIRFVSSLVAWLAR